MAKDDHDDLSTVKPTNFQKAFKTPGPHKKSDEDLGETVDRLQNFTAGDEPVDEKGK